MGSYRTNTYALKFKPLIIKQLMVECGISQTDLMRLTGHAKATINLCVNRGYIPSRYDGDFKKKIQKYLLGIKGVEAWLGKKRLSIDDIWEPLGSEMRMAQPRNMQERIRRAKETRVMEPGDPEAISEQEVEMLSGEAMKHFKIFRNPFQNDIRGVEDIYMSDEHRYIEAAMIDAAKNGGFLAVVGEVGSGKSSIRKKVAAELGKDDTTRIIYPRMIDKTKINASSLCDAIVMDLSDEKPRMRLEQKTRQVERLLVNRAKADCHVCLIIEEAHDLSVRVLKLLKRFHEIEHGYRKVIGIILIGQPELGDLFSEADHYDMREVIRRCQVAYIRGLNGDLKAYLELKFRRVGTELKDIMTGEAIEVLSKRLKEKDHKQKVVSKAYPLTVNNQVIRAMNLAYEMGENLVTEAVVMAI